MLRYELLIRQCKPLLSTQSLLRILPLRLRIAISVVSRQGIIELLPGVFSVRTQMLLQIKLIAVSTAALHSSNDSLEGRVPHGECDDLLCSLGDSSLCECIDDDIFVVTNARWSACG